MNGDNGYFRLGVFILVGTGVLIAGIVMLGAGALLKKTLPFETVTTESVEGLTPGAPVKFRGVTIGKVSKLSVGFERMRGEEVQRRLEARNEIVISMEIDASWLQATDLDVIKKNVQSAAQAGMRARITSSGIAGPPYVELLFMDPAASPPPSIVHQSQVPYIPAANGTLSKIAEDVGSITDSLRKSDLDKVVGHVDHLILTVDQTVQDLRVAELRTQVGVVVANIDGATKRLNELLASKALDATLTDLPGVSGHLKNTLGRADTYMHSPAFNDTTDNLAKVTGSASLAATELRRTIRLLNETLASQQESIADVVANLRRISEDLGTLTEDLKQNPSRALFGRPPAPVNPGGNK